MNAAARGAAVNPDLVELAQQATRGGPRAALATAPPMTTVSDAAGRFTIAKVPPGDYVVRAQIQNYFGAAVNGVRAPVASVNAIRRAQQTTEVRLSMIRGGTISGRVLDPAGKPLQNSPVQALQTAYDDETLTLRIATARPTDDRGEFRLGVLPPGEYFVAAAPTPGQRGTVLGREDSRHDPVSWSNRCFYRSAHCSPRR